MGKISPVSIKYVIHADLKLTGVADKPDIIGAIFGQTEGLLGSELELRELQKAGRIGRIDVNLETKKGKTFGEILLPSSMGKAETAIVAAAIETIEKVGPCNSEIKVLKIEDVRLSKRDFIMKRAKELLGNLVETLPDSTAFTNELTSAIRAQEIREYGADKLPAGPDVDSSEELIIVEGRADVVTLLKYGMKNVIGLNGARAGDTIIQLCKQKITTLFIDGDRGGDLILRKLADVTEIDFVAKAPDGKEVEELTQKEIQKALRAKVEFGEKPIEERNSDSDEEKEKSKDEDVDTSEQQRESKDSLGQENSKGILSGGPRAFSKSEGESEKRFSERKEYSPRREYGRREYSGRRDFRSRTGSSRFGDRREERPSYSDNFIGKNKTLLKEMSDELVGTHGAFVLDEDLNILGKVPAKELADAIQNMGEGVFAVLLDGEVNASLAEVAEHKNIQHIIAKDSTAGRTRVRVTLAKDL